MIQPLTFRLRNFYQIDTKHEVYEEELDSFFLDFVNEDSKNCPNICFLKIEVDQIVPEYKGYLENFFSELGNKKINFFTDISNFKSLIKDGKMLEYAKVFDNFYGTLKEEVLKAGLINDKDYDNLMSPIKMTKPK